MFQWDKSITQVEVEADKVLHLFKSMRDVQLALPGVSAQEATAYLCQYVHDDGVSTVAVFHLLKANVLAFYHGDPFVAPVSQADSLLDEGLNFVESMGFLLTDQDLHLLEAEDQKMFWESLPLSAGGKAQQETPAFGMKTPPEPQVKKDPEKATAADIEALKSEAEQTVTAAGVQDVAQETNKMTREEDQPDDVAENVDDLLAAVESMRAKRPGLRARKVMPPPEDMDRRKRELRENIGRILASQ